MLKKVDMTTGKRQQHNQLLMKILQRKQQIFKKNKKLKTSEGSLKEVYLTPGAKATGEKEVAIDEDSLQEEVD